MALYHIDKSELETWMAMKSIPNVEILAEMTYPHQSRSGVGNCLDLKIGCTAALIEVVAKKLDVRPWWKLLVKEQRDVFEARGEESPLIPRHREHQSNKDYYEMAFSLGTHVTYLTIMSEGSFQYVDALIPSTELHVMTWMPDTRAEILGFAKHLHEPGELGNKVQQVRSALKMWDKFKADRPNVHLYTYSSSPTLQGMVVKDLWAKIELMPFDTRTSDRPALILRKIRPQEKDTFELFSSKFRDLLKSSKERMPGDPIPEW